MNITEAMVLWKERLADDCEYRIASGCKHYCGEPACKIQFCPLLRSEAKISKEPIYNFRDMS